MEIRHPPTAVKALVILMDGNTVAIPIKTGLETFDVMNSETRACRSREHWVGKDTKLVPRAAAAEVDIFSFSWERGY